MNGAVRLQVTVGQRRYAKYLVEEQMNSAFTKYGSGAFATQAEILGAIQHQLHQIQDYWNSKDYDGFQKQLAQISQLGEFGIASVEAWKGNSREDCVRGGRVDEFTRSNLSVYEVEELKRKAGQRA